MGHTGSRIIRVESETQFSEVPVLFIDLDGTIRFSAKDPTGPIQDAADVRLFPWVENKLWEMKECGYLIVIITNQGGVAYGYRTMPQVQAEIKHTVSLFQRNPIDKIMIAPTHPDGLVKPWNRKSLFRKPDIGLLALVERDFSERQILIKWDQSLFVGDRQEDRICAGRAGIDFQWAWDFFGRLYPKQEETLALVDSSGLSSAEVMYPGLANQTNGVQYVDTVAHQAQDAKFYDPLALPPDSDRPARPRSGG
jgi:D-glycero-D-manno-heptose 1,7-bisphosphate phosphatase